MAMRSVVSRSGLARVMEGNWRSSVSIPRYFSDGKGRVLAEEERAKEIKMERERLEELKKKKDEEYITQMYKAVEALNALEEDAALGRWEKQLEDS